MPSSFVAGGVAEAVERAVSAAGARDVEVMGADTARQVIAAGLLDELQINLVPVLLGRGVRMFPELGGEQVELDGSGVVESSAVTHLRYRVRRPASDRKSVAAWHHRGGRWPVCTDGRLAIVATPKDQAGRSS